MIIYVSGKVQGVFFRVSTQFKAKALGLSGYVQNQLDGRVKIEVQGNLQVLETFKTWCKQGPELAEVTHIEVKEIATLTTASGFDIRQ